MWTDNFARMHKVLDLAKTVPRLLGYSRCEVWQEFGGASWGRRYSAFRTTPPSGVLQIFPLRSVDTTRGTVPIQPWEPAMTRLNYLRLLLALCTVGGCATSSGLRGGPQGTTSNAVISGGASPEIQQVGHAEELGAIDLAQPQAFAESLLDLEQLVQQNPTLSRLWREYQAAQSKVRYIDELPDPKLGANFFLSPIETAAGSQRANLTLSQMLPWLPRLDAQAQQACFEATMLGQVYESQRLKIVADLRATWYRIYVLQKQIDTNQANQELLETLIDVANSQVSTGRASQGDVLAGTLEYSKLEEQVVTLRQQLASTKARLNRLIGRDVQTPIAAPQQLDTTLPDMDQALLRSLAWSHQPDIQAAQIRTHATRWGVEVARLKRRPDFTVSASWFAIDNNRPTPNIVDVGQDAWAVGAKMTLPIRGEKYDAMEQEALWKHAASGSSVEEVKQEYDALLVDLWEQARAADETARLYRDTILPEAKRVLEADQEAYANGKVEFDRIVRDFRNVITLELGYHRSLGQIATAMARIWQATGGQVF